MTEDGRPRSSRTLLARLFDRTTLVFLALLLISLALVWTLEGPAVIERAFARGGALMLSVLPQLAAGLTIGAFVQVLVRRETIAGFLERGPALAGPAIGMVAGALTPSGPFVSFPMTVLLWRSGTDVGTVVAYITGWALVGIERALVWELPIMGPEFTALRYVACLPGPILAGLLARQIAARTGLARDRGAEER